MRQQGIKEEKGQTPGPPERKAAVQPKKPFVRRPGSDRSQAIRRTIQVLFVLLNLWIGVEFYLFVRHYETAGQTPFLARPAGVEGWLPIASLMNLKYLLFTGNFPSIHPAGLVLFLAFIGISLLWAKSFCSWLCPVGTLSEALWKLGRKIFRRNIVLPRWLDWPLRSLKYILLGLFFLAVGSMSIRALESFLQSPYGLIAEVKMLNFFRQLSLTSAMVLAGLTLASLFIQNFWCRYLCPYGAFLSIPAFLSVGKIRRNAGTCIDCAKCAKACPSLLPVDKLLVVRSVECTSCLECVAVCPVRDTLQMALPGRKPVPEWVVATGVVAIFLGAVALAKLSGHWDTPIPGELYFRLIPQAYLYGHP